MSFDDYDEHLNDAIDIGANEKEVEGLEITNTDGILKVENQKCDCKDDCDCDMNPCNCNVDAVPEPKTEVKTIDPLTDEGKFELVKQKLKDKQDNKYMKPDKIYVEITIPSTGKVGEECIIKTSKEVPLIEYAVSEKLEWKKKFKHNRNAKKELCALPFKTGKAEDTDEVRFKWEEIAIIKQKNKNVLHDGDYLVEVSARSKKAGQETISKRLIEVEK